MNIYFKKLTTQEAMDKGLTKYVYINPLIGSVMFMALIIGFGFIGSVISNNHTVATVEQK